MSKNSSTSSQCTDWDDDAAGPSSFRVFILEEFPNRRFHRNYDEVVKAIEKAGFTRGSNGPHLHDRQIFISVTGPSFTSEKARRLVGFLSQLTYAVDEDQK